MAITEQDLSISNVSYTNKDFGSIYSELLDIAKKISYKFDPLSSNESDPFIILLKLMAFVGDKVNYNVDKNILEQFTTSLTQRKSMYELTARLGCPMHYFRAAETSVILKTSKKLQQNVTINAFAELQDATKTIKFTTLSNATLTKEGSYPSVKVIQGELKSLSVLGSPIITTANLDENQRLYLPEYYVAENGIFIKAAGEAYSPLDEDGWKRVQSINGALLYGSKVYELRFDDDRGLPYIQFPAWIEAIIGGGLNVSYIVTKGAAGNVAANAITSLINADLNGAQYIEDDSVKTLSLDDIIVRNTTAALTGKDPDTIEEAYNNLKRQQGTFETLVTCRDYANYIYNQLNKQGSNFLVSNIQVGDRRNDINYAFSVTTFDDYGPKVVSQPDKSITAYDLTLYPFEPAPIVGKATEVIKDYNKTFTGLSTRKDIIEALEGSADEPKAISHDYKSFKDGDIYAIKNYYKLTGTIYTTEKVDSITQIAILENVKAALARDYNAREVAFGYEIPYDELIKTIEEADSRIKSVNLYEPELEPRAYLVLSDDESKGIGFDAEQPVTKSDDENNAWFNVVVYKNILAGTVSLFDYDESFRYNYNEAPISNKNQRPTSENKRVGSFTSNAQIKLSKETSSVVEGQEEPTYSYTLKTNESIQCITDKYQTTKQFGYGIYYYLKLDSSSDSSSDYLPENEVYTLGDKDTLIFVHTNESGKQEELACKKGDIIRPNFTFYTNAYWESKGKSGLKKDLKTVDATNPVTCYQLTTNQEVDLVELAKVAFKQPIRAYWHLNNEANNLTFSKPEDGSSPNYEYILQSGEEIFITDSNMLDLQVFGEGSRLVVSGKDVPATADDLVDWGICERIADLTTVYEESLEALQGYFKPEQLSSTYYLEVYEQEIVTLSEGDALDVTIEIASGETEPSNLRVSDNAFLKLSDASDSYITPESVSYTIKGKSATLSHVDKQRFRGLLDVVAGPDLWQTLEGNQKITFNFVEWNDKDRQWESSKEDPSTMTINASDSSKPSFKFDTLIQKEGGENVSLAFINLLTKKDTTNWIDYPQLYCADIVDAHPNGLFVNAYDPNYLSVTVDKKEGEASGGTTLELTVPSAGDFEDYFMLYSTLGEKPKSVDLTVSGVTCLSPSSASKVEGSSDDSYILYSGVYIFKVNEGKTITFTNKSTANLQTVQISRIRLAKSTPNPRLNIKLPKEDGDDSDATTISEVIADICKNFTNQSNICNYLNFTESSKALEMTHEMKDGETFFDVNNIANKWVIPQLDFNNSTIKIAANCKK